MPWEEVCVAGIGGWRAERARVLIPNGRLWMPPVSPRSGEGTRRPIRRGEPTGLVPWGAGGQGRLQAAADGGRAPSLEFLLTRNEMLMAGWPTWHIFCYNNKRR
jgi:hypothetical protein